MIMKEELHWRSNRNEVFMYFIEDYISHFLELNVGNLGLELQTYNNNNK
jgi:hypothetical protein